MPPSTSFPRFGHAAQDLRREQARRIARHLADLAGAPTAGIEEVTTVLERVVAHLEAEGGVTVLQSGALSSRLRDVLLKLTTLALLGAGHFGPTLHELERAFREHCSVDEPS
jgi:hypothetical protein